MEVVCVLMRVRIAALLWLNCYVSCNRVDWEHGLDPILWDFWRRENCERVMNQPIKVALQSPLSGANSAEIGENGGRAKCALS